MTYRDILVETVNGACWITLNRPEARNALLAGTVRELLTALGAAARDPEVASVVLTGAGDKTFCAGGDLRVGTGAEGAEDLRVYLFNMGELEAGMRHVPKPVLAAVNGAAFGGGCVLAAIADLTIASDKASFNAAGPRIAKADAGYGTAYLARVVGEKKAKEMWMLCRTYGADDALAMGLVNKIVPAAELRREVQAWADELLAISPTALRLVKHSFNADTASIQGISHMGGAALEYLWNSEEAAEAMAAFLEKRSPDFTRFRKEPR